MGSISGSAGFSLERPEGYGVPLDLTTKPAPALTFLRWTPDVDAVASDAVASLDRVAR
jgi:hypothetical protein